MKISDAGLELIRGFEGYHDELPDGSCRAYLDKLAKPHIWTIGYGCTEGIAGGMVWTHDEAVAALAREIAKHEAAVTRLITVELNQHEFDALVSFSYNCGAGALEKSTLRRKLNAGDRRGAASEFKRWNKAGGKVWPGLVDRRAREATLFLTPVNTPAEPAMPQRVEESLPKPGWKTWISTGLTGGAAAGQALAPAPAVTETVNNLSAWQSLISTGQSVFSFGVEHWPWVTGVAGTMLALSLLNRRAEE